MMIYKVFYKNYERRKGELMGMLIERRRDLRGKTPIESGLRWAKFTFRQMVKDQKAIFVLPNELNLGSYTNWAMEKAVFNKEESLVMLKLVEQTIKREVGS